MQRSQKYRKESIHQKMSILTQSNKSFSPNKACNSTSKYSQKSPSCNHIFKGLNSQKSINDKDLSFQVKLQNLNTKKPLQSTFNLSQHNLNESQKNVKQKMEKILHSQLDQSQKSGNPLSQTFKSFINKNEDRSSLYSSAQNSQSTSAILAQQINKVPVQLPQDADIKVMLEQLMYENQSFDKSQDNNQIQSLNYMIEANLNQTQNDTQLNFDQSVTPSLKQLVLQKQENSLDILQLRNQIFQNQKPVSLKDLQYVFAGRNESDQFPTEMFKTPTQGHNNEFFTFTAEEKKEQLLKNLMGKITIEENQFQKNDTQNSNQSKIVPQNIQKGFQKRKSAVQMQFEPMRKQDLIGQILSAGSFKQRINLKCDKSKNKDLSTFEDKKMQNQISQQELMPVKKFDTIFQKNQLHRDASVNIINKKILDKESESLQHKSSQKQLKSQISQRNSKSNDRIAKSFSGMTINLNFNNKILEKNKNRPETVIRPSQNADNNKDIYKTMEPMIILQKPQFEQKQNLSLKKNKLNGQNFNNLSKNMRDYSQVRENKPRLSINSQLPQVSQFLTIATCKSNQYNSQNHASLINSAQPTQRFSKVGNQKQFSALNNNHSLSKIQDKSLGIQSSNSKIFKTFDNFKQRPIQLQSIQNGSKFKSVFSNQNNDLMNDKKNQASNLKDMKQNRSQKLLENYSSTKSLSVTRQKSQNAIGQASFKHNSQSNYISQKKEEQETNYIQKVRQQAEQAQKQLFKISQIQAQKKKEKLMKKNNGLFQNNQNNKDIQQAKQFQNLLYNPVQKSKMDPNIMPILQNKNTPCFIRQKNKQTQSNPYQSRDTMGISAQIKILKQSSDIQKFKNSNLNSDDLSKNKKESPLKQSQKSKQSTTINLDSQTYKSSIQIFKSNNEKDSDVQKQFISNLTLEKTENKQEFDSNQEQFQSSQNEKINDNQQDYEHKLDNEYVTLQNKVKHLLFIDDDFEIIQNQDTEMKNFNNQNINQNEKYEFNSQSQKQMQLMKGSFNEDIKIDFIQEVFCKPSSNFRDLNLSIQRHDFNTLHQKSQADKISGSSSLKQETPYLDCQYFLIKTQERSSRRDNRIQKRTNQYKSMIDRTNSRSKSNETQMVDQSINKEIYHDQSQDLQLVNSNKSQYTSSSLHHKKNSSIINKSIEQCSIERKNKFDKLQKSLKFLKLNFGNVVKGYKARRIIYNIKELREARLKAIVYQQLSSNNHQCYENKILEHRQNLAFLFQKYWANNIKQSATDWIKMGQQKEVKNDKKQLNMEKKQVLDEINMNIKFLQSLNNSERKEIKEEMMEETVVFNNQMSINCKLESENEIDKYIQNVDEDVKAIQIDMTDSVEDLDCTVQIQNTQDNTKSNVDEAKSNHYRSTTNSTKNQKVEKTDSEISNQQSKKRYLQAQNKHENKTFRSMIPQLKGDNLRSSSQNRSKSRFSQESSRIPRINPSVQKKSIKLEKQNNKIKNNLSNLSDLITIEIKPIMSKPSSIRNDKKQLNKKRDIYQSYDEQGFSLQDKKSINKESSKKIFFQQKYKKHSQSKIQSPMKEITPKKYKIQKEEVNKENPEQKCSTQSKNHESTLSMNMQTSKSVQFFENKKVLEDEVDELCCEALKDLSNSSLNINNSFYSQNKIIQGDKQSIFPQFPPEFMKLIELNKRKKELIGLDKFSKAQLKSAISELMKELDDNE